MRRAHSIRARLSLVFLFLFLIVIALGLESMGRLSYVNDASAQIRDRWLPSTRALGDLNNLTTDFPAAETAMLRDDSANERAAALQQMVYLDRGIAAAQLAYRQIRHDATENGMFSRFEKKWGEYRSIVARGRSLPSGAAATAATRLHENEAKSAYDAASDMLGMLTERNVASVREAGERSDLAYRQARRRIALMIFLAGVLVAGALVHITRSLSLALQATMLQDKLAEEQRLTLLQRNFVSMASHEFRTPLAIIDGHTQRLISTRDRLTADELAERARKIRSMVRRMTQLIDNLIGSARLLDARIELYYHPTQVDLKALVRDVCHLQRELTPDAQILAPAASPQLAVYGDASLLSQLFSNLLSNAVKYSPDGGLIQVTAVQEDAQITVEIEDHGIGIPETDRERVFERYYRGSNTSGIVGSGVGLSLVKMIVDLHKGGIALHSREGEGSRFTLCFPAMSAEAPSAFRGPAVRDPAFS
jgi:two-component system OmpR family sensor kinase